MVSSVVAKDVACYAAQVNMNAKVKVFAHGWYPSNFVITEQQCLDILVDAKKKHKGKFTQIANVANGHLENFECVFLECPCIVISIWIISVELESYFELALCGTRKSFQIISPLEPGDAFAALGVQTACAYPTSRPCGRFSSQRTRVAIEPFAVSERTR